jgi:hypothetical protein
MMALLVLTGMQHSQRPGNRLPRLASRADCMAVLETASMAVLETASMALHVLTGMQPSTLNMLKRLQAETRPDMLTGRQSP